MKKADVPVQWTEINSRLGTQDLSSSPYPPNCRTMKPEISRQLDLSSIDEITTPHMISTVQSQRTARKRSPGGLLLVGEAVQSSTQVHNR